MLFPNMVCMYVLHSAERIVNLYNIFNVSSILLYSCILNLNSHRSCVPRMLVDFGRGGFCFARLCHASVYGVGEAQKRPGDGEREKKTVGERKTRAPHEHSAPQPFDPRVNAILSSSRRTIVCMRPTRPTLRRNRQGTLAHGNLASPTRHLRTRTLRLRPSPRSSPSTGAHSPKRCRTSALRSYSVPRLLLAIASSLTTYHSR